MTIETFKDATKSLAISLIDELDVWHLEPEARAAAAAYTQGVIDMAIELNSRIDELQAEDDAYWEKVRAEREKKS